MIQMPSAWRGSKLFQMPLVRWRSLLFQVVQAGQVAMIVRLEALVGL